MAEKRYTEYIIDGIIDGITDAMQTRPTRPDIALLKQRIYELKQRIYELDAKEKERLTTVKVTRQYADVIECPEEREEE